MNEYLQKNLKRLSNQMQSDQNPDNIIIMEAMCEIEDLQAKYDTISHNYTCLIKEYRELSQRLIDTGNAKLIHPDWDDPNWKVGFISGVSEMLKVLKEAENELY